MKSKPIKVPQKKTDSLQNMKQIQLKTLPSQRVSQNTWLPHGTRGCEENCFSIVKTLPTPAHYLSILAHFKCSNLDWNEGSDVLPYNFSYF